MAWTAPRTWVLGEVVTEIQFNAEIRDNFLAVDQHGHSGAAGDGGTSLGSLVKETFTDAAAPAAPGAGKTVVYAVSGRPRYRAGAAGADTQLADASDLHNEDHASRHEPSGADAMAVDAVAGTGSLRTLGAGAQQGAAGNHTHVLTTQADSSGAATNVDEGADLGEGKSVSHAEAAGTTFEIAAVTVTPSQQQVIVASLGYAYQKTGSYTFDPTIKLQIDGVTYASDSDPVTQTTPLTLQATVLASSGAKVVRCATTDPNASPADFAFDIVAFVFGASPEGAF